MSRIPDMPAHLHLYLIEASLLAAFMLSACAWTVAIAHPASPIARRISRPITRRALIGFAMATTAVLLITSPWGRLSGAHMNPAVTIAFTALGKVDPRDAIGYITAQCAGGIGGVLLARALLGRALAHPSVRFIVTQPGPRGPRIAFAAEFVIAFLMLSTVLLFSNLPVAMAFTPLAAATLVFLYITFEAPLSGMSLNPARTLGSAVVARSFRALPIYLVAPTLGMLAAAGIHSALLGAQSVHCAKLDHRGEFPCPFHCTIESLRHPDAPPGIDTAASEQHRR